MPAEPTGRICYVELPATDIARSSAFYRDVFGFRLRTRNDGVLAFDDGAGHVSGAWVTGRAPNTSGMTLYIMVPDADAAVAAVRAAGCEIVQDTGVHPTEILALFRDPGGNLLGIYQGARSSI